MITHLPDPEVEAFAFSLDGNPAAKTHELVIKFMDELPDAFKQNPDGMPQILVYDTSKPLAGFSSLGHEYGSVLEQIAPDQELENGDIVVFQAREKVQGQNCASSTKLGDLRRLLWKTLVDEGLMETPKLGEPGSLQFLWVTDFPMFKMVEQGEPGQGGAAGIAAAHHPFTAPKAEEDLKLLLSDDYMQAKSAAYDLVLNGVEIGGGSVRNHIASVQRLIMTDVLKMAPERVKEFDHLFEVLEAGCPPHAGFALGFDRMVALMSGTSTVRDVIAFPKTMKGEDLFVKSPSKLTQEQLAPYNLRLGAAKSQS
jgi:aspartyl-tRNA synthetase